MKINNDYNFFDAYRYRWRSDTWVNKHGNKYKYVVSCIKCGCDFLAQPHTPMKFCSNSCSTSYRNHIEHPSKRPEVRKKISIANSLYRTGKNHSQETRKRIGMGNKGKKRTQEHIEKMKSIRGEKHHRYGKCWPERSILIKGQNNPNWKGGISCEPYCIQWTDKEYKNWLKYERDGGKCQNPQCTSEYNRICLHHINYNKKDCRPTNLITICISCNSKANKDREWYTAYYTEILRRKYVK